MKEGNRTRIANKKSKESWKINLLDDYQNLKRTSLKMEIITIQEFNFLKFRHKKRGALMASFY
jgi:hypothetical protein